MFSIHSINTENYSNASDDHRRTSILNEVATYPLHDMLTTNGSTTTSEDLAWGNRLDYFIIPLGITAVAMSLIFVFICCIWRRERRRVAENLENNNNNEEDDDFSPESSFNGYHNDEEASHEEEPQSPSDSMPSPSREPVEEAESQISHFGNLNSSPNVTIAGRNAEKAKQTINYLSPQVHQGRYYRVNDAQYSEETTLSAIIGEERLLKVTPYVARKTLGCETIKEETG